MPEEGIGIEPTSLFKDSGLAAGRDGGLLVNTSLQSVAHPEIFGGGDCISLEGHDLAKVGVYAVRENPILYHNLRVALEGGREDEILRSSKDLPSHLQYGERKGYLLEEKLGLGRPAFLLKDYIDRSFMKKFQVSGERDEPLEL